MQIEIYFMSRVEKVWGDQIPGILATVQGKIWPPAGWPWMHHELWNAPTNPGIEHQGAFEDL